MFNEHFNERAQVHRYNCSNLLLQVSAVGFFAGSFATRLVGTCVAKVICIRMRQSVRGRDKIAALTNESRRQGVHFFKLHLDHPSRPLKYIEGHLRHVSSTEFPANYCIK